MSFKRQWLKFGGSNIQVNPSVWHYAHPYLFCVTLSLHPLAL